MRASPGRRGRCAPPRYKCGGRCRSEGGRAGPTSRVVVGACIQNGALARVEVPVHEPIVRPYMYPTREHELARSARSPARPRQTASRECRACRRSAPGCRSRAVVVSSARCAASGPAATRSRAPSCASATSAPAVSSSCAIGWMSLATANDRAGIDRAGPHRTCETMRRRYGRAAGSSWPRPAGSSA